jgi:hypothetical protein
MRIIILNSKQLNTQDTVLKIIKMFLIYKTLKILLKNEKADHMIEHQTNIKLILC